MIMMISPTHNRNQTRHCSACSLTPVNCEPTKTSLQEGRDVPAVREAGLSRGSRGIFEAGFVLVCFCFGFRVIAYFFQGDPARLYYVYLDILDVSWDNSWRLHRFWFVSYDNTYSG